MKITQVYGDSKIIQNKMLDCISTNENFFSEKFILFFLKCKIIIHESTNIQHLYIGIYVSFNSVVLNSNT